MKSFNEFIKVSLLGAPLLNKMFGIFLISMLPVVELRGAIPVGAAIGLPWYLNMIVSIVGNLLPVPFILLFSVKAFEFMKKHNILVKFIEKIENRRSCNWRIYRAYVICGYSVSRDRCLDGCINCSVASI